MEDDKLNLYVYMSRTPTSPAIAEITKSPFHDTPVFMMYAGDKLVSSASMAAGDRYRFWENEIDTFKDAMIQYNLKGYNIFDGILPDDADKNTNRKILSIPPNQLQILKSSLDDLL